MLKLNARKSVFSKAITLLTTTAFLVCTQGAAMGQAIPKATKGGMNVAAPPVDVLPQVRNLIKGVSGLEKPTANKLVIHQNEPRAIIDWESFNIGKDAWTHFDQQGNTSWIALNRIYDRNPSLIFGKLTADGRVFLINQNGILFGRDSRVNVYNLTASTLNIKDDDFLNGQLKFKAENYQAPGEPINSDVYVSNEGTIETATGGSAYLIGQNVENSGAVSSPLGQVGLAAGADVVIAPDPSPTTTRTALVVNVRETAGEATNLSSGRISTDNGLSGMYGRVVNQDGIVRAVTAVKKAGKIELHASERISTGAGSVTATPVTESDEKVNESFPYQGGEIQLRGLDPANAVNPQVQVEQIVHRGRIEAPSGLVNLEARQRVFLENQSSIDVSGVWVNLPAEANLIQAQLNSVNLRDDFGQKSGFLKGRTVAVSPLFGSTIGDISGYLASQDKTALERSTAGGDLFISAHGGDIIIKQAAGVDFSGGGLRYAAGKVATTQLLSNGKVYDISVAPQYLSYSPQDNALGYYNDLYARHELSSGIKGLAEKLYFGLQSVSQALDSHVEGSDAGSLTLASRQMVLDGRLDGSVTRGAFQNLSAELLSATGNQMTRGRKAPLAGTLTLGVRPAAQSPQLRDLVLERMVILPDVAPLVAGFGPEEPLPAAGSGPTLTELSAGRINTWGLRSLQVNTNTTFSTETGAQVDLAPGGSLLVIARRIEHRGGVSVPAGTVSLQLADNVTGLRDIQGIPNERYIPLTEKIYLENGSRLSAAGQSADNALAARGVGQLEPLVLTAGGSVQLTDGTSQGEGVFAKRGASIDVSGGVKTETSGKISGGHAGSLGVTGATIALDAELKGHSLIGKKGAEISLHAGSLQIADRAPLLPAGFGADSEIPADLKGKLLLASDRFASTGFTRFNLSAADDILFEAGAGLSPSLWKLASPNAARGISVSAAPSRAILQQVPLDQAGATSFSLKAGQILPGTTDPNLEAVIRMPQGAFLAAGPGGKVSLDAPSISLAGRIEAPAGTVSLKSRKDDVAILSTARILAAGTNVARLKPVQQGFPAGYEVFPGGSVSVDSARDIIVENGALIDVSGSAPTFDYIMPSQPGISGISGSAAQPVRLAVAGAPGSVSLAFTGSLQMAGDLRAAPRMAGLKGGSLSILGRNLGDPLAVASEDLNRWLSAGFDGFEFASWHALELQGPMDAWLPRSLTLDAPEIRAAGDDRVRIGSAWVRVANTYFPSAGTSASGGGDLELHGRWIDIDGSVSLSGFADVKLAAESDIRFSDHYYQLEGRDPLWEGRLSVPGALTLQAVRAYPTTLTEFTVAAAGKITTLPGSGRANGLIYSAGGRLTLQAADIEHRGALYAPMGEIALASTHAGGRIYLAQGSVLSSAGEAAVKYGDLDENFWTRTDKKSNLAVDVTAPSKGVSLQADEVIMREGALVDASGGGALFSYQFLPGLAGTNDPLKVAGRYVIVPDGSVQLPGQAVYIAENSAGLKPGTYSLLPEEFAFLPGAVIIKATGSQVLPGALAPTQEGFPTAAGYFTYMGTGVQSTVFQGFSVRPAADVLREGFFNQAGLTAGDSGQLAFSGKTTILDGSLRAQALPGYLGGALELIGTTMRVLEESAPLPQGFGFDSAVPVELAGTLNVADSGISGKGFQHIALGSSEATETITIQAGSRLDVLSITLAAKNGITLENNAQIHANAAGENGGSLSLYAPTGRVSLMDGAFLQADRALSIDTREMDVKGGFYVATRGAFYLAGDALLVVPDGYARTRPGVFLEERFWSRFGEIAQVTLKSRSDLVFAGDVALAAGEKLTLDAARLAGMRDGGLGNVTISAGAVSILNSGAAAGAEVFADSGRLVVNADAVNVGRGSIQLTGFSQVEVNASGDVAAVGKGSLTTSGDLRINAARLTVAPYTNGGTTYEAADFRIEAPGKAFALHPSGGAPAGPAMPGGILTLKGETIDIGGTIEMVSGNANLEAGTGGVFLTETARILARGSDLAPAGQVRLVSQAGAVSIGRGALIDVSAGEQGDAGTVYLSAPIGGVALNGSIQGLGAGGRGGALFVDTNRMDDFAGLNQAAASGGFTEALNIRARGGDIVVSAGQTVHSRSIAMAADAGEVRIEGLLNASAPEGGSVALFAGTSLRLAAGSRIEARGTGANAAGGEVLLSAAAGDILLADGAVVDVSGSGTGGGGIVSLRALQQSGDVRMTLAGAIAGASAVYAEGFRVYTAAAITSGTTGPLRTDAQSFMNNSAAIETRLLAGLERRGWEADGLHLLPGIEVRSAGDMTLSSDWDLTSWRFGGEPGALTLRAGGHLNLNANLVDHPTSLNSLPGAAGRDSWSLNLAAGADLTAADPLGVQMGSGDLKIGDGRLAYTESAPIRFASGRDTDVGPGASSTYMISSAVRHNIGSYDGKIAGSVGRDLVLRGGAVQTATGDIGIRIARNLSLQITKDFGSSNPGIASLGTIRTTGRPTTRTTDYWSYADGGDISLQVGGSVDGALATNAWDAAYGTRPPRTWGPSFSTSNATEGLATMGGGSLSVSAGGSFFTQAGTFGRGDLEIVAGGNVLGRFAVKEGTGRVISLGSAGSVEKPLVFEVFDVRLTAVAFGDLQIGAVVNPTIAREQFTGSTWDMRYSTDSSVRLISKEGDVRMIGDSSYYNLIPSQARLERIMPPTLEVHAGRDILIENELALMPAPFGKLVLSAGRDINGEYLVRLGPDSFSLNRSLISMSDADPALLYGVVRDPNIAGLFSRTEHAVTPVHAEDPDPVTISAGRDIKNLQLYLPKQAEVSAGRDIVDIFYSGQNVASGDATRIHAGRDIYFSTRPGTSSEATGIAHGGPGVLSVMAGNSIDLGTTSGISSYGNAFNSALSSKGSDLFVSSGYSFASGTTHENIIRFFNDLIAGGRTYSNLLNAGDKAAAQAEIDRVREQVIRPLLGDSVSGTGVIDMTTSQISTISGKDNIFILSGGNFNVGRSVFIKEEKRQSTGIFTASGGAISIYAEGDINVNESRVMTFFGGDIAMWSDSGDINAGRGSRTAINLDPPKVLREEILPKTKPPQFKYTLVFTPPAVGSGIRAVTYDPDGIEGPQSEPPPGDIDAFAPQGFIDAGEAGIAGGRVTLGATAVLNAQNISFAFGSVGVPDAGGISTGIGALAGAGSVSETTKIAQESSAVRGAEERLAKFTEEMNKNLVPKIIMVEVMGFEEEKRE